MRRFIGGVNLLVGLALLYGAYLAAAAIPPAITRFAREPEDLYLLIVLCAIALAAGASAIQIGSSAMAGKVSKSRYAPLAATTALVCGLVMLVVGLWSLLSGGGPRMDGIVLLALGTTLSLSGGAQLGGALRGPRVPDAQGIRRST